MKMKKERRLLFCILVGCVFGAVSSCTDTDSKGETGNLRSEQVVGVPVKLSDLPEENYHHVLRSAWEARRLYGDSYFPSNLQSYIAQQEQEQTVQGAYALRAHAMFVESACGDKLEDEAKQPTVFTLEVGPLWRQRHAESVCPTACFFDEKAEWTGHWWTTIWNEMSVCECKRKPKQIVKFMLEVGPLWRQSHAHRVCPTACPAAGAKWTGHWWTTVWNEMSVCECELDRASLDFLAFSNLTSSYPRVAGSGGEIVLTPDDAYNAASAVFFEAPQKAPYTVEFEYRSYDDDRHFGPWQSGHGVHLLLGVSREAIDAYKSYYAGQSGSVDWGERAGLLLGGSLLHAVHFRNVGITEEIVLWDGVHWAGKQIDSQGIRLKSGSLWQGEVLADASELPRNGKWQKVRVQVRKSSVIISKDGRQIAAQHTNPHIGEGYIGFAAGNGEGDGEHRIRKIKIISEQKSCSRLAQSSQDGPAVLTSKPENRDILERLSTAPNTVDGAAQPSEENIKDTAQVIQDSICEAVGAGAPIASSAEEEDAGRPEYYVTLKADYGLALASPDKKLVAKSKGWSQFGDPKFWQGGGNGGQFGQTPYSFVQAPAGSDFSKEAGAKSVCDDICTLAEGEWNYITTSDEAKLYCACILRRSDRSLVFRAFSNLSPYYPKVSEDLSELTLIPDDAYGAGSVVFYNAKLSAPYKVSFEYLIHDNDGPARPEWNVADGISVIIGKDVSGYIHGAEIPTGYKRAVISDGSGYSVHFAVYGPNKSLDIQSGDGNILSTMIDNSVYIDNQWIRVEIEVRKDAIFVKKGGRLVEAKHLHIQDGYLGFGAATGGSDGEHKIRNISIQRD